MLPFRSKLGLGLNYSDKKSSKNLKYVEAFFMAQAKTEAYIVGKGAMVWDHPYITSVYFWIIQHKYCTERL